MADERRIVIELKVADSDGSGASTITGMAQQNQMANNLVQKLRMIQHPFSALSNNLLNKATLGKVEFASYTLNIAKNIAKNGALYFLNRYYNLSEDYKSEQNLRNTMSVLEHIGQAWTSILGGAITGAKVGQGWGAAIGAVVGATGWTANTLMSGYKAHDSETISLSTMNIQSGYQKVRLGLIDDGRGTQN